MMKRVTKVLLTAALAVGMATGARADLTLSGASGMFLNPDARINSGLVPQVQVNYNDLEGGESYGVYGAMSVDSRMEVSLGAGHLKAGSEKNSGLAVSMKQRLLGVPGAGTQVAYGLGYDGIHFNNLYGYAAVTQDFGSKIGGHSVAATLGLRWDRFGKEIDSTKTSVFGGVDVGLNDKLHLIGELQGRNTRLHGASPYALGVRYAPARGLTLGAGIQRTGWSGSSGRVFLQAGYKFGG